MPPGTVLIAVGPVPCLVAQYYLKSLPLAGLILVDPSNKKEIHPLLHNLSECKVIELMIVEDLAKTCSSWDRPLQLEPGSVPMLIL
eukprot:1681808-Ditylum_brightwellii.AAC.1